MPKSIKRVEISGLHGWLDFSIDFSVGINVFYGPNGSGKTTLLHVIANILGADIGRFLHLTFSSISVEFMDEHVVRLVQKVAGEANLTVVECYFDNTSLGTLESSELLRATTEVRLHYRELVHRMREVVGLKPTYFPAFRSMLEATSQIERLTDSTSSDSWLDVIMRRRYRSRTYEEPMSPQTQIVRALFGDFTPVITYPSLKEVDDRVEQEVGEALLKVATANRQLFSRTFLNSLDAVTGGGEDTRDQPDQTLAEIEELLQKVDEPAAEARSTYDKLAERVHQLKFSFTVERQRTSKTVNDILVVYKNALEERLKAQREAFDRLQQFLDSVNSFLEQKQLDIVRLPEEATGALGANETERRFIVRLENGTPAPISILSSGERQLVCLVYSATRLGRGDSVVLIDEPELSLNIDWQRRLLTEMQRQMGTQQIIVCTHSPDIGGDHEDAVRILQPSPRVSYSPPPPEPEESRFLAEDGIEMDDISR